MLSSAFAGAQLLQHFLPTDIVTPACQVWTHKTHLDALTALVTTGATVTVRKTKLAICHSNIICFNQRLPLSCYWTGLPCCWKICITRCRCQVYQCSYLRLQEHAVLCTRANAMCDRLGFVVACSVNTDAEHLLIDRSLLEHR